MIEILGRITSSNVQAVMWGAQEMNIALSRLDFGGSFGGNDTADYLKMNPMGLVPVLRDGDFYMFESQAILRYLAARFRNEQFWPSDLEQRAKIDQWMEWAKGTVTPSLMYKVFWQLIRVSKADRDWALIEDGIGHLNEVLAIADKKLAVSDWLLGDNITLADISFATPLYRYMSLNVERAPTPHLDVYYKRLTMREAYQKNVMISYESLRHPDA